VDVGQIVAGYQWQVGTNATGTIFPGGSPGNLPSPNFFSVGAAGTFTDRPTITYTPLTGFGVHPHAHDADPTRAAAGADRHGYAGGSAVPGRRAAGQRCVEPAAGGRAQAADPDFVRFLTALRRIQDSGAIGFRVEPDKESGKRERLRPDSISSLVKNT